MTLDIRLNDKAEYAEMSLTTITSRACIISTLEAGVTQHFNNACSQNTLTAFFNDGNTTFSLGLDVLILRVVNGFQNYGTENEEVHFTTITTYIHALGTATPQN